jgi:hypothetical protein
MGIDKPHDFKDACLVNLRVAGFIFAPFLLQK